MYSFSAALGLRPGDFWECGGLATAPFSGGVRARRIWTGMPKLPKEAINTTFFLFANAEDAKSGEGYGGTGFLIGRRMPQNPSRCVVYAVTNAHVAVHGFPVIRLNKKDGGTHIIDLIGEDWTFDPHGHDIAVTLLQKSVMDVNDVHANFVMDDWFATDEAIAKRDIGVGDDVCMVGRFINADGAEINRPAARFGNISLMPIPMRQEINGAKLSSYCIDMHSRDGFSGSPVFVFRKPGWDLANPNVNLADQFFLLLGIHWGQFPEAWEIKEKPKKKKKAKKKEATVAEASVSADGHIIQGLSGMTCVAPASAILALLNQPKLRDFFEQVCAYEKIQREEAGEEDPASELATSGASVASQADEPFPG